MTASSRRLRVLVAAIALFLVTLQVCDARAGGGMVYIYYVETDRGTYELGQSVNVTAAWYILYEAQNPFQYSEAVMSCWRGQSCLSSEEWLNETNGYHVHQLRFLLMPDDWNPSKEGENGAAECSLFLQPDGPDTGQRQNFTVTRARQNCALIKVLPTPITANASAVSLFLRIFNANNSSFGVALNSIYFNVTNPSGRLTIRNNSIISDPKGNFTISFDPSFVYGAYHVSLRSADSGRYLEGRFNFTIHVDRSPIPSNLSVRWNYAGNMYNSSTSYALEPANITAELTSSLDGTRIDDQQLDLRLLDSSTLQTVWRIRQTTNASGFVTSTFTIPYEGEFILEASYDGLVSAWSPAFKAATTLLKAKSRDLSIVELVGLPPTVTLNRSYPVRYLVLDLLSEKPVPKLEVTVKTNDSTFAEGSTDEDGVVEFALHFPCGRLDLVGNTSLFVEACSNLSKLVFHGSALCVSLHCTFPTFIRLQVSSLNMLEDGDTVVLNAELMSLNHTPVSNRNVEFTILIDQGEASYDTITKATDQRGICNMSLKLLEHGVVTIIARFAGNSTFDSANDTCSFSVLPAFHERLSSSVFGIVSAGFLSVISIVATERFRRKTRWQDISIA
jgi:hypothetical protein